MKRTLSIFIAIIFLVALGLTTFFYFINHDSELINNSQAPENLDNTIYDRTGTLQNACGPPDALVVRLKLPETTLDGTLFPTLDIFIMESSIKDIEAGNKYSEEVTICNDINNYLSCRQAEIDIEFEEMSGGYATGTYRIYGDEVNNTEESGTFKADLDEDREICG